MELQAQIFFFFLFPSPYSKIKLCLISPLNYFNDLIDFHLLKTKKRQLKMKNCKFYGFFSPFFCSLFCISWDKDSAFDIFFKYRLILISCTFCFVFFVPPPFFEVCNLKSLKEKLFH